MVQLNPTLCEETNQIQMRLVHFTHAILGTWWKGELESLACSQLYYVRTGTATILCNSNQLLTMQAGNWYLLPTGMSIKYWCEVPTEIFSFHLKLCNIDQIDILRHCQSPCQLENQQDLSDFFLHCINSDDAYDGLQLRQKIFSVLLSIIKDYHIPLSNSELSAYVSKAIIYINNHLSVQLTLDEISKNVYVSKSTLQKRIKEELQISVHKYIYNAVMFEASQLLLKTNLSVRSISERFGFCDQFYFSRKFKELFGKSPKEFRKMIPM